MSNERKYDSDPPDPERGSDRPPDFDRKRDRVMRKFAPGTQVTQEIISERDRMEERLRSLEVENAKLRARVELDTAVVELLGRVEKLEKEKQELLQRIETVRDPEPQLEEHFRRVEADFANLASLYVASSQLHSSLSPRRVARCIKEILGQLLGAKSYCIYLESDDQLELVPVAGEGGAPERLRVEKVDTTPVGKAFASGRTILNEDADPSQGSPESPCAAIPLLLDDRVVGVIAIFSTLPQKTTFRPVDFELFKLLGRHAALALTGASLFAAAERRLPAMDAWVDLGA